MLRLMLFRRFRVVAFAALSAIGVIALATLLIVGKPWRQAKSKPEEAQRAFYYWRTTLRLTSLEEATLARLGVSRLYLRFFDIEWSAAARTAQTVAKLVVADGQHLPQGIDVVPVVFIRNDVFSHLPGTEARRFAHDVWAEASDHAKGLGVRPREWQVDCDWTDGTREVFFEVLRQLREDAHASGTKLSATIRLHQVKYRERTGVPPVDRGMLMFYNMGTFDADPESRAIFDAQAAQRYLGRIGSYPLELDAALPIWSWVVHLRDGDVEGLMQATDPDELPALDFLRLKPPNRYEATRSAFLHGILLREGDILKVEVVGPNDTLAAATMLAPLLSKSKETAKLRYVSLFDLSEKNIRHHGVDALQKVLRQFH